eukprot:6469100-Amphidinium_carterae.4
MLGNRRVLFRLGSDAPKDGMMRGEAVLVIVDVCLASELLESDIGQDIVYLSWAVWILETSGLGGMDLAPAKTI